MSIRVFEGFGGVTLVADTFGHEEHPCVLLLPGATQTRKVWEEAAKALANAGRYVVSVDLRGHGESGYASDGRYDADAYVNDLKAILSQLSSRPVIVGSTLGGWIALTTLGEADTPLATGIVLTNPPSAINAENLQRFTDATAQENATGIQNDDFDKTLLKGGFDFESFSSRFNQAASKIRLPVLVVRGEKSLLSSTEMLASLANTIPNAETAEIAGAGHYVAFDNDEFNAVLLAFLERRIPREPSEYVSGSDPRTLRDAMGCFASGITVVTTKDENGKPVGLTANSFTSVSLDPPLVLVCLGKNVGSLPAFNGAEAFAVNILHTGQQPISNLFASKGKDRFTETDWQTWDKNVPIISNSLANFECIKTAEIEQGDHILFIGEVVRARFDPRRDPLLYSSGKYRRLHFD